MRLGIIGGLGPMATAYFMELLINMTDVFMVAAIMCL